MGIKIALANEIPRVKITDKKIALVYTRCVFIEDREVNNVFLNVPAIYKRYSETCPTAEPSLTAIKPTCSQSADLPTAICRYEKNERTLVNHLRTIVKRNEISSQIFVIFCIILIAILMTRFSITTSNLVNDNTR